MNIPKGSILLYRSTSPVTLTPLSVVNHVAIQLGDGHIFHMTHKGIKINNQYKMYQKNELLGYIKIKNPVWVNKIVEACWQIHGRYEAYSFLDPTCTNTLDTLFQLFNPSRSCIDKSRTSNLNVRQIQELQRVLTQDELPLRTKKILVCSTTVFLVLVFSLAQMKKYLSQEFQRQRPLFQSFEKSIRYKSCVPDNVLTLHQEFPDLFELVEF